MQKGGGIAALFCAVLIALQAAIAMLSNQPFGLGGATQAVNAGAGSLFASETLRIVLGAFLLLLVTAASARSGARARAKGQTNWIAVIGLAAALLVCISGACSVYLLMSESSPNPLADSAANGDGIAVLAQILFGGALLLLTLWQLLLGLNSLLNRSFPGLVALLGIVSAALSIVSVFATDMLGIALALTLVWLVAMGLAMLATPDQLVPAAPPLLIDAPRKRN